jgi:uncharacterized protein
MRRALVLIGLLVAAPVFAQDGEPDYFRITNVKKDDNVNVRRQPNAEARIVGKIPKDADGVKNLGCNRGGLTEKQWEKAKEARKKDALRRRWCQVEYEGVKGWVSARFLEADRAPAKQQAVPAPQPAPSPMPAPQMAPAAQAFKPSFDCEKAEKNAEKLICGDAELAAVDREMARLYKIASDAVNATPDFTELLDGQRAWVLQRNTCFDRECVADISVRRIHQLRQAYADARRQDQNGISMGPVAVRCEGQQALIGVTFVNSEPGFAYLEWTDRYLVLPHAPGGSSAKFEGSFASFSTRGDDALVTLPGGKEMKCKVEK